MKIIQVMQKMTKWYEIGVNDFKTVYRRFYLKRINTLKHNKKPLKRLKTALKLICENKSIRKTA